MTAIHKREGYVREHDFGGFQGAGLTPKDKRRTGVVLYLHGGGYTCGNLEYAKGFAATLADECGVRVFCAAYRLAPESRFPAALASASLCVMGMLIALLLERCIPDEKELAARPDGHAARGTPAINPGALRSAMVTTAAIVLHNLPEGILTLFTSYASPTLGATLTLAIALHNIPEGIAISVPVYYATNSRVRGALYALLSGLAEPAGALLAFFLLRSFISPLFLNGLIATIAGIMIYVSISELIPEGFSYGRRGYTVGGLVAGILAMSVGIYLV